MLPKPTSRAAGPPVAKAEPLPTKRPVPIAPPMAIICMCRPFSFRLSRDVSWPSLFNASRFSPRRNESRKREKNDWSDFRSGFSMITEGML